MLISQLLRNSTKISKFRKKSKFCGLAQNSTACGKLWVLVVTVQEGLFYSYTSERAKPYTLLETSGYFRIVKN